jgi:hypothetical protein
VLAAAITQIPARFRSKLLVRVDGAGASHDLITHLLSLATVLKISPDWPWTGAFITCWQRLCALPAPA